MMKNNFNPLTVSQMIRQNVGKPENIEKEIERTTQEIHLLRDQIRNLRLAKYTLLKKYDFIKSQEQFDELLDLATLYPEIESGRQLQIISLILKFKSAKEIAELCFLSEKAIKWHKTQIFNKLDVFGSKGLFQLNEQRKQNQNLPTGGKNG